MNEEGRRDNRPDPRDVLDSMRAVLDAAEHGERLAGVRDGPHPPMLAPPPDSFKRGVEAYRDYAKRMTPDSEGACDLGPYEPSQPEAGAGGSGDRNGNGAVHLDGEPPKPIKFPPWWRPWFAKQTLRTLRILDKVIAWLDARGEDEADRVLADLSDVVERHRARRKLKARLIWAAKVGGPALLAGWSAVVLASERIGRFIEQLPVLRAVWKAVMGPN